MNQPDTYSMMSDGLSLSAQLGDTFLSCDLLDYLASIAEFISGMRA
jgi:hypothetical protein